MRRKDGLEWGWAPDPEVSIAHLDGMGLLAARVLEQAVRDALDTSDETRRLDALLWMVDDGAQPWGEMLGLEVGPDGILRLLARPARARRLLENGQQ